MEGTKGVSCGPGPISEGGVQKLVNPYNMLVPQWGNVIGSIKNVYSTHMCDKLMLKLKIIRWCIYFTPDLDIECNLVLYAS
jgi:hypothetical protein